MGTVKSHSQQPDWTSRESIMKQIWTIPQAKEEMLSNSGAGEDSWESLGQQGDQTSQS